MILPFGTRLVDIPLHLHEVLLFHDAQRGSAETEARAEADAEECYAPDGAAPRLLGRPLDGYLLCFDHDRLKRIDAAVLLAADEAARVFVRACTLWLKTLVPPDAGTCEGRDGGIAFSARLAVFPDHPTQALSMTLCAAP